MERSGALAAVFQPVQPPTTFEETVERLGTAIRLGLLSPGEQLPPERELAEELNIARSTLRQALTTLVQSGHLVSVRGRAGGTFVSDSPPLATEAVPKPSEEEMRAKLDYRVVVETGAVLLAAERAQEEDIERMSAQVDVMDVATTTFEEYRRADVRFHIAVAEASHSPRVVSAMTEVQGHMTELIGLIAHPEEVLTRSNQQHKRLCTLVSRGDGPRAAKLMREHVEGTEHILAGLMPEG
jgi:GntR family transcriptional regulator, transcriptional repressor for pyruvate dehydrogenase complex